MNTKQLQEMLNEFPQTFGLTVDGVAGKRTMAAVDAILKPLVDGILLNRWSDTRRMIGAEQAIYARAGIEVGKIDGLIGEQTRFARTVWDARQANHNKPVPAVEQWRDKPQPVVDHVIKSALNQTARLKRPPQSQVEKFYGQPGTSQEILELPFEMRLAWEPSQKVSRFSCHTAIHDDLRAIWTSVLNEYGLEKLRELRLDMYGGCLNVRHMRGGTKWSMHSWGIAEDVDPDRNQLNFHKAQASLDDPPYLRFWQIVYDHGFISLGIECDRDYMHFQATKDFS